jgi:uncharacterized protein
MTSDNVGKIRSYYEAFARRDDVAVMAYFDPHVEWTSAENFIYADESPYIGLEAVRNLIFVRLQNDWDDFSLSAQEITGGDEVVIASGRFRGIFKTNGAAVNAQFVQVFQFRNGKIWKCQTYTDTAQFKEALARAPGSGTAEKEAALALGS